MRLYITLETDDGSKVERLYNINDGHRRADFNQAVDDMIDSANEDMVGEAQKNYQSKERKQL